MRYIFTPELNVSFEDFREIDLIITSALRNRGVLAIPGKIWFNKCCIGSGKQRKVT